MSPGFLPDCQKLSDKKLKMKFKITTLVENSVAQTGKQLIGEHGLSFHIETETNKILFDTGQNLAISNNAKVLGIDLSQIDTVVLSHGHYDHTGGLKSLVACNGDFTIYAHPAVFGHKLKSTDGHFKYIGIPLEKMYLEAKGIKLKLTRHPAQVTPGIMATGEIPLENDFEELEPDFYLRKENQIMADTLADDQALILETTEGITVLLGCSHRGVINTLNHVVNLTGKKGISAMLGGLHLGKASDSKLKQIMDSLHEFDLEKIGVGHCTSTRALMALSSEFPNKVFLNTVGNVISL
jgi:7,8-dihydropterin-6-yl-methyl-4-(beta-D-ribofuranosyl)aminobenzene 5'-phosphate synthase